MSMNRVIHGAFRRDLDRFVDALGAFPDGDSTRAAALGRAWANFDAQLVHHHEGEHETAWPHLERAGITRDVLDQMDAEHEVMAGALEIAREEMNALVRDPSRRRALVAMEAMNDLRVATLTHLDHEERELEAFYVREADNPEVKAMEAEFRRQSPAVGGTFFAWILDGITPDARAAIFVPGPVLGLLTGIFGRGYRREVAPVWR